MIKVTKQEVLDKVAQAYSMLDSLHGDLKNAVNEITRIMSELEDIPEDVENITDDEKEEEK